MKTKVLAKKNNKFLIERFYKEIDYTEYLVCLDYDFKSNTYVKGVKTQNLPQAYDLFNHFVNTGTLEVECELDGNN